MRSLILTTLILLPTQASLALDTLEEKEWLGYFAAWETRDYGFGIGVSGKCVAFMKKGKELKIHDKFYVNYLIQEQIKGKWQNRRFDENSVESPGTPTKNSKKPIPVTVTFTGGTKVQYIHRFEKNKIITHAKLIEKKTETPIRILLRIRVPNLFPFDKFDNPSDKKKKLKSDTLTAKRIDGKSIEIKFHEQIDFLDDAYFPDGVSSLQVKCQSIPSKEFTISTGSEKHSKLELYKKGDLHRGFSATWTPDMEKLSEKDCYVSFGF